jgi:hypothetical protein
VTVSNDGQPTRSGSTASGGPQRPSALVFIAVAVGGLGVGFGVAATVLMIKSKRPQTAASALPAPSAAPSAEKVPIEGSWTSALHSTECPDVCCGGSACAVSSENSGKNRCKPGSTHCEECTSGLVCIPGACGERVTPGTDFALHLSSILERGSTGEPVDSCRSQRDLWLCVGRSDDAELRCVSQREACSNQARSPVGIRVTSEELLKEKLLIEVREGGPDGATLAQRQSVPYRDGLQRRGLCGGLKLTFEASAIAAFTFYLDVPADEAPEPVNGKRRADAAEVAPEAVPSDASAPENVVDGGLDAHVP